jgi:hypothetical protein
VVPGAIRLRKRMLPQGKRPVRPLSD